MKGGDLISKGTASSYKCLIHTFVDKSEFEVVKTLGKTVTNTPLRWTISLVPTGLSAFHAPETTANFVTDRSVRAPGDPNE